MPTGIPQHGSTSVGYGGSQFGTSNVGSGSSGVGSGGPKFGTVSAGSAGPQFGSVSVGSGTPQCRGAGGTADIEAIAKALTTTPDGKSTTTPDGKRPRINRKRRRPMTPSPEGDSIVSEVEDRLGHDCEMMPCRHRIAGKKHRYHWEIPLVPESELLPSSLACSRRSQTPCILV